MKDKKYKFFVEIQEDDLGFWVWRLENGNLEYIIYMADSRIKGERGVDKWVKSDFPTIEALNCRHPVKEVLEEELPFLISLYESEN